MKLTVCVFQDIRVYSEEVELDGRDPEEDYQQYKLTCEALAQLMNDIQELKANGAKDGVRNIHTPGFLLAGNLQVFKM